MAFADSVRRKVQEMAAFRCCRCQCIGVQVHHIVPESNGGSHEIDNAAPLCASCHAGFGDNPAKRAEIRHMRDWWYETVRTKKLFATDNIARIDGSVRTGDLARLKSELHILTDQLIDAVSLDNARTIASAIVNASTGVEATRLADKVYANVVCNRCNSRIGLLVGTNRCPNCGLPIQA